jgi:predicted ArsR family transcriptional regulator
VKTAEPQETRALPSWTFLSNHAHVLLLIARDPDVKLRDVAVRVGITERAVQRIVADLEAADYLERKRTGRRNHYQVHSELPLRHPIEAHTEVGALLDLILKTTGTAGTRGKKSPAAKAGRKRS